MSSPIPENILKQVASERGLSDAEQEALFLALDGKTTNAIAVDLGISAIAVRKRLGEVYKKFNIEGSGPGKLAELRHLLGTRTEQHEQPYVEHPRIERRCYEEISQPGALIRIKAPKQMGKTLLMNKILDYAEKQGYKIVYLNFLEAEEAVLGNLDEFLRWFCVMMRHIIVYERDKNKDLDNSWTEVNKYWNPKSPGRSMSKTKCTDYFEEELLEKVKEPALVLGLDNVDQISDYKVKSEFFHMLRLWYERRSRKNWGKLRQAIAYSTEEDYITPENINRSPFNVGLPIELPEFTDEQVKNLIQQNRLNLDDSKIQQLVQTIVDMVGGHPYLVQEAISYFKIYPETTPEEWNKIATEGRLYENHLRKHLLFIYRNGLKELMGKIVKSEATDPEEFEKTYQLQSIGLIKIEGNKVKLRCKLYQNYFESKMKS